MSPTGRPKGESRRAQHEGAPAHPTGRPKGESRRSQHTVQSALLVAAALLPGAPAAAAPMRDPTLPPASLRASPAPRAAPVLDASAAALVAASRPVPRTLLVIDGRRYVVEQGRRRGVGDTLSIGRIERIDESSVWVRQGGSLRALPMYGSVVKRAPTGAGAPELADAPNAARRPDRPQIEKTLVTGEPP